MCYTIGVSSTEGKARKREEIIHCMYIQNTAVFEAVIQTVRAWKQIGWVITDK